MWAVGALAIIFAVWFRAVRKLTANLTAFWGITGILLVAAGTFAPLPDRAEVPERDKKGFLYLCVGLLLPVFFLESLLFSGLAIKNQELAVRFSLLRHEEEQRLAVRDERNEKNSFCN